MIGSKTIYLSRGYIVLKLTVSAVIVVYSMWSAMRFDIGTIIVSYICNDLLISNVLQALQILCIC